MAYFRRTNTRRISASRVTHAAGLLARPTPCTRIVNLPAPSHQAFRWWHQKVMCMNPSRFLLGVSPTIDARDRKDLQSWIAKIYNTIEKNGRRFSRYVLEIPPNFQSGIDSHLFEIICVLVEISDFLRYIQRNASNLSEIIFDVLTYFYMGALRRFPRSLNMNLRISSIGIFESPPSDLASAP